MAARQKKQALTTRAAIERVLAENGGKMKVKAIIEAAVPLTALAGRRPAGRLQRHLFRGEEARVGVQADGQGRVQARREGRREAGRG